MRKNWPQFHNDFCRPKCLIQFLGYADQALRRSHEACTLAHELAHPQSLAAAHYWAGRLHLRRGEVYATHEQAEVTMTLATEHVCAHFLPLGMGLQGWVLLAQGQGEEGMARIGEGLTGALAQGNDLFRLPFLALLAEAYGKVEKAEKGLPLLAEARAIMDKGGQCYYDAELHRIEGTLQLEQAVPDASKAETWFQKALSIARNQKAKSWELRAATSLSRLWKSQGKGEEAYDLLAPVYNWFSEGFDTADLKEAKTLLEELS